MGIALPAGLPALADHIRHVRVKGSKKQMVGIDTLAIVATVQDICGARIFMGKLVRNAVRIRGLAPEMDLPIAVGHHMTRPFVATVVQNPNLLFEPFHIYPAFQAAWPYVSRLVVEPSSSYQD